MKRIFSDFLASWLASERRKPLIVRGARQVGKTWLVRELARSSGRMLLEVNFDRNPEYARIFREEGSGPRRWLDDLALRTRVEAPAEGLILFLDEIDANVSGEESHSVGKVLKFLAQKNQIFAISHQPQLTSLADAHFLVTKTDGKSEVKKLDEEGRIQEIARIISGESIGSDALSYAKTLREGK